MSQSGFSTALSRLRLRLGDPLFVRTADGMTPTPRASRMVDTAREVLQRVRAEVLSPTAFDPATMRAPFRLAMPDVAEIVFMPRLMPRLQALAPQAGVTTAPVALADLEGEMRTGGVDLALGYFPDLDKQAFFHQRLYRHTFCCLMRADHPLGDRGLTEEAYRHADHAVVSSAARSTALLEQFLRRRRVERKVALTTPHQLSLPLIVATTDLIATLPLAAAGAFARLGAVRLEPLPFVPPTFPVQQHWHRLYHHDARNRWLRQQVAALFNDATDEWRDLETAL